MAPRDKKGILFILRAVVQSYISALCVHSRLANVLFRFNLDNKFQRGGGQRTISMSRPLRINQGSSQSQLFRATPCMTPFITFWERKNYTDDKLIMGWGWGVIGEVFHVIL